MSLLENIFVSLRVLSKVPEGGRICTSGDGQIKLEDTTSGGGWVATGRRMLTGDSRDETVKCLMRLINNITEISDNIINSLAINVVPSSSDNTTIGSIGIFNENSKKCHTLNKLCTMLKNAARGIANIHRSTYNGDVNITAKLDEILDRMNQQQDRIAKVLDYINSVHKREKGFKANHKSQGTEMSDYEQDI